MFRSSALWVQWTPGNINNEWEESMPLFEVKVEARESKDKAASLIPALSRSPEPSVSGLWLARGRLLT